MPFFVDTDLTRPDGIVRCRRISEEEMLRLGWRMIRALKYLGRIPIEV